MVLARRARLSYGERVLDVGCGAGASLVPASMVSGSAFGVDASLAMLRANPLPAALVAGDGGRLPFATASFDVVLCGFVLQFLDDAVAASRDMHRVLRPGGRLLVSLPEADVPAAVKVKQEWGKRLGLPPPIRREPAWAVEVVREAGFEQVETSAEEHTFSFESGDSYVDWCRSHGGRALIDAIEATGPDEAAAFASELAAAAESERERVGIPLRATARFVAAVRGG
ncbi:MAG TPA: class I SAM-dependent methyltransferase [Acidimicrobiales bacterium]